ncbi:metallophosphoesterase [bacterium]|nr:metallophosphoesterase [bacterium]
MSAQWRIWLISLTVIITTSAVLHWYFWSRLIRDVEPPAHWVRRAGWAFVVFTFLIPVSFWFRRNLAQPLDSMLFLAIITWLSVVYFFVCLRVLAGAVPVALRIRARVLREPPFDPRRRRFLSRALAAGTIGVGVPSLVYGVWKGFDAPALLEIEVRQDRLPPAAHGLSLVQLTDLHVTTWTPEHFVSELVARTNALRPDVVVMTGDLVDGLSHQILSKITPLGNLRARYGTYFVTGNHEYYVGFEDWSPILEKLGLRILHNRGTLIADAVYLAGVPDRTAWHTKGAAPPDFDQALRGAPPDRPAVLLAHQPRDIDAAVAAGATLQISGHTHGGQIWPFGMLVMAAQPYLSGLHRHGSSQIYVSRGAGTWGPPIRIAAPPEIAKIILV